MDNQARSWDKAKGKVVNILTSRPWLLPFIYHIYSLQGVKLIELKTLLGLKTAVVKRGLWWLIKSGIVEKKGEKYVISQQHTKHLAKLMLAACTTGRRYVVKIGKVYLVAVVRKSRITAYSVPEDALNKLLNRKLENRSIKDIAAEVKMPLKLTARALKLYETLNTCWR
ncbi:MAG: hypothetical protein DRO13_03360 [Thermoprotei archaeon]|nr:MAG: hypothetical protein DRO13_03360 [Thermoprotei archaeon]